MSSSANQLIAKFDHPLRGVRLSICRVLGPNDDPTNEQSVKGASAEASNSDSQTSGAKFTKDDLVTQKQFANEGLAYARDVEVNNGRWAMIGWACSIQPLVLLTSHDGMPATTTRWNVHLSSTANPSEVSTDSVHMQHLWGCCLLVLYARQVSCRIDRASECALTAGSWQLSWWRPARGAESWAKSSCTSNLSDCSARTLASEREQTSCTDPDQLKCSVLSDDSIARRPGRCYHLIVKHSHSVMLVRWEEKSRLLQWKVDADTIFTRLRAA